MKAILSLLLAMSTALLAASGLSAQTLVSLHIQPDTDSAVYTNAELSQLDQFNPQPIVDPNYIGQGWESVLYRGNYTGFVRNDTMVDQFVRPGTKVYLTPSDKGKEAFVLQNARQARFEERINPQWSRVTFNGVIPLYFMRNAPSRPVNFQHNAPLTHSPATPSIAQPIAPASSNVGRVYFGKFERVGPLSRLFGAGNYALIDTEGQTIAYVDVSKAMFVGPIENYWDKWVKIEGIAHKRSGSVPLQLEARFISTN